MTANLDLEFLYFVLIFTGFTLFFVKMILKLLTIALFSLGIGLLYQFNFVISFQTIIFWGFLIEAIIAFILDINLSINEDN